MAQLNIRMDDNLKEQAEQLFNELGLNMSTAFNIFARQSVREGRIPFDVTIKTDPFYSEANQLYLKKAITALESGKGTLHELVEVEDGQNLV